MTRDDLITLIGELIGAGQLTLVEGRAALQAFDAGDLVLPDVTIDLRAVLNNRSVPSTDDPDAEQDTFEQAVSDLASRVDSDPAAWAGLFAVLVASYLAAQWLSAGGRNRTTLDAAWAEQQPFIQRFAATAVIRSAVGRPLTPEAIASRSVLYGGAGRALWYVETENGLDGFGWVVDYVSVDDNGTCSQCWAADRGSPYLPGVGPRPGQICLGRGRCRCKRIARYSPAEADRLRGRNTPTATTRPK